MSFEVERLPRTGGPRSRAVRYTFTREEIIELLQRWLRDFGEPPRAIDLEPARARRLGQEWRAERFESEDWPSARMVVSQFGSFNAALSAAGISSRLAPARIASNLTGPGTVTDAIRAWVRLYGEVPALADWDPARARRLGQDWRIARYNRGDWPSARTVQARFGSMSKAIQAAGLPSRPIGSHGSAQVEGRKHSRSGLVAALASDYALEGPHLNPEKLITAVRSLAHARRLEDPTAVHSALMEIAARALAWAEYAGADATTGEARVSHALQNSTPR